MKYLLTVLLFVGLLHGSATIAQTVMNNKFKFENGIYTKHQNLKDNKPAYPLFKIPNFEYQLDSKGNLLFLSEKSLAQLEESEIKSMDNIWGLCIDGKPYMKIKPNKDVEQVYFVRYYILGAVCYLYYPVFEEKTVEMYVYNPYTGKKMGSKPIVNQEKKIIRKLMSFETGELKDYNTDNLMAMIAKDKKLVAALADLAPIELENKLFESIKIYNDRNPILAPQK